MPPLALLAHRGHIVNAFVELRGDALFVHQQTQALRVGEGGG
jgi:hypothetical protein